jgi:hypothetical protein
VGKEAKIKEAKPMGLEPHGANMNFPFFLVAPESTDYLLC